MEKKGKKYFTNSARQTQELGRDFAKKIKDNPLGKGAFVFGLSGDLGSGKTTFLQGFAEGLGVKEKILSPTFVIFKKFKINGKTVFKDFYHIDCYRLSSGKDLLELRFKDMISDPKNIIAIEWPEIIEKILPKKTGIIKFKFVGEKKRAVVLLETS
ncbi:MAG: tRNA (adenosine(37)-N6)-threonylcarbamoyltransferase complex ATPase subunit type 1 TsaE [Candidatus Staskawiczbacteria bacterium]|jgi:tRNA threonylcarbamoyladenosine biosynthesis protein TsaE